MSRDRRFDIHELIGADDHAVESELGEALAAARSIESALGSDAPMSATPDLAGRIMVAVAREPAPHALGIAAVLRRRPGVSGFVESLRLAWSRAFRGAGRPFSLRVGALAYVAAVLVLAVSLSGVALYATAGALGLFGPNASRGPDASQVIGSPAPIQSPSRSEPPASQRPEPSESEGVAEPSDTAEPSDDDSGEDHGGSSAESGDDGGSGSSDGSGDGSSDGSGAYSSSEDGGDSGDGWSGSGSSQTETQTPRPSPTPDEDSSSDG